jgi:hypothetical protein
MNALIPVTKDFGEPMAIMQTVEHAGVLILVNRFEQESKSISLPGESHQYTIVGFERPPELCGVDELKNAKVHANLQALLHKKFLKALIETCIQNKVTTVYCNIATNEQEAIPYKTALSNSGITLLPYESFTDDSR